MEAAREFYGPWFALMLWVGVPLLVVGTLAMLPFERGSFPRWATGRVGLIRWVLVLLTVADYLVLRIIESAFSNPPRR